MSRAIANGWPLVAGVSANRNPTTAPIPAVPAALTAPSFTGTAQDGSTLTGARGTYTNSPTTYANQWQSSADGGTTWTAIAGAPGLSFVLTSAQVGKIVRLVEGASNAAGASALNLSPASATVAAAALLTPPTGYYANGSTNPTWSSAVASVRAGNATRFVAQMVGDSTTVGRGGGTDGSEWNGAVVNRPARWVADRLTLAGATASHQSFIGDGGAPLTAFNTAIGLGGWTDNGFAQLAGGSYLTPGGAALTYATTGNNRYRVSFLNEGGGGATPTFLIDGAAPTFTSGPAVTGASPTGFTDMVVGVAGVGAHTLSISGSGLFLNGVTAVATTGGIDVLTNAVNGITSAGRNTVVGNYASKNFITQQASAVTIINLGLNDMAGGVAVGDYITNIQALITAAKTVGDVLLMFPHPAGGAFNTNVTAYHAATKQLAVDNSVAFFSLFEFEGGVFTAADMQDGVVHPNAATYQRYHTATGVALLKMAGL